MSGKKVLLFFGFLAFYSFSIAQKLEFEHITDKDGLVSTSVISITKDSYGYMWFGTFSGLSKYDGYTFTNYLNDPKNDKSIPSNSVRFVYESRSRLLFIGFTYAGFCIYNREKDTFEQFKHDPENPASLSHNCVATIFEDKKGSIWIGTREGLDKFDVRTKKILHYKPAGLNQYPVSSICEDQQGNLWLYGRSHDLYRFNPEKEIFEQIIVQGDAKYERSTSAEGVLAFDHQGNLWIGSGENGLFKYNPESQKYVTFSVQNKKLKSNIIRALLVDSEGKVWVGSDGGGLYLYDNNTQSFSNYASDRIDPTSLSSDAIYSIYETRPGEIWVGVFAAGVNIYKQNKKKFQKYTSLGKPGYCLSQKSVLCMAEAPDGKIWLGTDGGGLDLFDPQTHRFKYYTTQNSIIHANVIKSITLDKDHNLWLGSYAKGLAHINFDTGLKKVFVADKKEKGKSILINHVWDIVETFDKKIWLGLLNLGINVYDPARGTFTYYPYELTSFLNEVSSIYVLFEDSRKRLWIGTEGDGIGYFDPEKKVFVKFKSSESRPGSISSNTIRDIFEDSKGNIWFATVQGGLNKAKDLDKGLFECYTVKDGLPTNNISSILEDDHHNLWLSTDKGISLFRVSDKKFVNFDIEDGLQSKEFNYNSSLKTKNGWIYFGGIEGFNMFHPDSIRFNHTPPPVVISDFKIFNKSIRPDEAYNGKVYLQKTISTSGEIILSYSDYIFSVEFAALDYTSVHKNKYAYKLSGFNENWSYVNASQRFATYTNLDPGTYEFKVIASNNDGVWNDRGATLRIIILPPWWMTWWFRSSVTLLLLALTGGFYYIRIRSIRKRNIFLEKEVNKRTLELQEANDHLRERNESILKQQEELEIRKHELEYLNRTKDKFFSIIGHDLKGPVRALTSLTTMLREESEIMSPEKRQMITNHVDRASHKVHDLVINLLEWARTQSKQVKVEPVPISVARLFYENIELLQEQASQKQIQIKVAASESHVAWGDYNMICTIIRNILSNSIKYTSGKGLIMLSSEIVQDNEIRISVSDNGTGMTEEVLTKLFSMEKTVSAKGTNNETGTGLGLMICKEFAQLNNGRIYAESVLGKGSTFYLILPYSKIKKLQN